MDGPDQENENNKKNTEYLPTKCRVTRPPPPKPATNPLQFVKVAPCPLFVKAQEQIKKVEKIKKERKEVREESEDWQANLDNWKSSRRKQQEHIIERVVEVKKLTEQEENERSRRKSKTFSEMMEERNSKGRPTRITIPIFNDDESNDLSDYGIGSSSSKANSVKDVDTDDSSSILDGEHQTYDSPSPQKDLSNTSDRYEEENKTNKRNGESNGSYNNSNNKAENPVPSLSNFENNKVIENTYTYEGAIQDYRSRIQSKIKVDESIFTRNAANKSKELSEVQSVVPKGEISKRKGLFELDKPLEINHMESNTSRRLSEDFVNAVSIKDRLKSLEKSTDQSIKCIDKSEIQLSVKQRLQQFKKQTDNTNNNTEKPKPNKISAYLLNKSNSSSSIETQNVQTVYKSERCSSPETEVYYNKLNIFSRDLDNLMGSKSIEENIGEYPPSVSSSELTNVFSDREDSGIHTTDVSCSVSQADETIDNDSYQTIPNCIEKLSGEPEDNHITETFKTTAKEIAEVPNNKENKFKSFSKQELITYTVQFLEELIKDATQNIWEQRSAEKRKQQELEHIREQNFTKNKEIIQLDQYEEIPQSVPEKPVAPKTVIYENVEIKPSIDNINMDFISVDFSLNGNKLEPPKVKPPPPPPPEDEKTRTPKPVKRLNSTKRIKKEINTKRTSFLGIEDSIDPIDPDTLIEKPPDINTFLQKESKLEKSLYKKIQEERRGGILSKVESQDSGLDIDRGRLSSDTWCSSIGDSSTPSHDRQDSEQTNSFTSEEDEISKKEREIIEMVEKEEKSKRPSTNQINISPKTEATNLESPFYKEVVPNYFDDQDSEVLKVEQELMQLEQEELKRQKENILFRNRTRLQNRHSLENICDDIYPTYANTDYRKSMPELQNMPFDFRKSFGDVSSVYYSREELQFGKSMPDIQHAYHSPTVSNNLLAIDYRKSMPELQKEQGIRSPPINRQPILPNTKPIRTIQNPKPRILTKPSLKTLSAVPRNRSSDSWIQPKVKPEQKHYNQHWVFQEAELRRLNDQQQKNVTARSWQQQKQDKPLPDSIIQTLTHRVQNRVNINDRNLLHRRSDSNLNNNDINNQPIYANQPIRHSMPTVPYSTPVEDKMLSVSGKKKCSYCTNELGRGAAMIIESLCLFYHMDCFKCCVCHIQLGDGRMGTDVRVRNQKLHCHNCYSSDDGVKFSCV